MLVTTKTVKDTHLSGGAGLAGILLLEGLRDRCLLLLGLDRLRLLLLSARDGDLLAHECGHPKFTNLRVRLIWCKNVLWPF